MPATTKNTPELIRVQAAVKRYGLSRDTLTRAVKAGHIHKHKTGRAAFYDAREIDLWIMGKTA